LAGIPPQIFFFERGLMMKQELVHVPEPMLECSRLCGGSRSEGVRVDLGQWELAEGESDPVA
jgi:hypothetical protein